ncbi:MAG: hypothetical protein ACYS4W_10515 [Planctomycetota bacterium]|jgi:hypothetical protein
MFHRVLFSVCVLVILTVTPYGPCEAAASQDTAKPGAAPGSVDGSQVIISLGEAKLTLEQINWIQPDASDAHVVWLAEKWLENQLLYGEAERRGMTKQPRARFIAARMRRNAMGQAQKKEAQARKPIAH